MWCGGQNVWCGGQNVWCGGQNVRCGGQNAWCGDKSVGCGGQCVQCGVQGHRKRRVAVPDNPSHPVTLPRPPRHYLRSPPPRCPRGTAGHAPSVPPPLSHHDSQLLQTGHDPEGSKPKAMQYIRSCYTSSRIGACTCAHNTCMHT